MRQTKNPLEAYFRANQGRLIHKWSHYFDIYDRHFAPYRGKEVRFTHVTQARGKAPTFVFFVDPPSGVHFTYQRYLENALRQRFGFDGTPIKIEFKAAHA